MELPSYILKGLLRNPPVCSFFIQPALLSLFTSECQSLPLFLPHFCIPPFNSCFFLTLLHLPTLLQPPPLAFSHHFVPDFSLSIFFSFLFCRLKLWRVSLTAPYFHSSPSVSLFTLDVYFCLFLSFSVFSSFPLPKCPVNAVIIFFLSLFYDFVPALLILPVYLCVCMFCLILLHLVPTLFFLSCPSCLRSFYFYLSHSLTSPLLFIWHPSLVPLLLFCTYFHLHYIYVYTLSLFYLYFKPSSLTSPPPY